MKAEKLQAELQRLIEAYPLAKPRSHRRVEIELQMRALRLKLLQIETPKARRKAA
jgi:hypothetical protein